MLQEGKGFCGIGWQKGYYPITMFNEIMSAGGGYKKFYSKLDAFLVRTVSYTTLRIGSFLYFYDWINPDARREARPDYYAMAGYTGGMVAGILYNPFEIVFTRMQVDELYPEQVRWNYKNFVDGLTKVAEEGALFRGCIPHGLKLGGLVSVATGVYDYIKENGFYFFGPILLNRLLGTALGVATAMTLSLPFDMLRVRMHTMRPLPNGEMPYKGTIDCFNKILKYEGTSKKMNNMGVFFAGGQAYFLRLYAIALISQSALDRYLGNGLMQEFWQPARYHYPGGLDYDFHDPYTDTYKNILVRNWKVAIGDETFSPDQKHLMLGL